MTELAEHYNPIGKAETLEIWRRGMRMPVPTAEGKTLDSNYAQLLAGLAWRKGRR